MHCSMTRSARLGDTLRDACQASGLGALQIHAMKNPGSRRGHTINTSFDCREGRRLPATAAATAAAAGTRLALLGEVHRE